jgi:hypothetical protein
VIETNPLIIADGVGGVGGSLIPCFFTHCGYRVSAVMFPTLLICDAPHDNDTSFFIIIIQIKIRTENECVVATISVSLPDPTWLIGTNNYLQLAGNPAQCYEIV